MKHIICIFFSFILLIGCKNSNSPNETQAQNEKTKIEEQRIANEKVEAERIQKEKAEAERIQLEKLEQERIEKEKAEKAKRQKSSAQLSCNHCGNTFSKKQGWYNNGNRIYQYGDSYFQARGIVGNTVKNALGGATTGDANGNPKFCSKRCAQLH